MHIYEKPICSNEKRNAERQNDSPEREAGSNHGVQVGRI